MIYFFHFSQRSNRADEKYRIEAFLPLAYRKERKTKLWHQIFSCFYPTIILVGLFRGAVSVLFVIPQRQLFFFTNVLIDALCTYLSFIFK